VTPAVRRLAWRVAPVLGVAACASQFVAAPSAPPPFVNAYPAADDTGERAPLGYFLRRARVQLTRDAAATELPPTVPLDLEAMAQRPFAVAWLGHSTLLVRAGGLWLMTDPVLSDYATPLPPFGPKRLTPLPPGVLPRIDVVLISHDHYDHLALPTIERLARQPGGPPRVLAGRGLAAWFAREAALAGEDFDWWQSTAHGELRITFVPAQHSSGRSLGTRNRTLWGGWVVEHGERRFYFAGDTAYSAPLFADLRRRFGPPGLAALPIGAYQPRAWMRHEHTDPGEAVQAHLDLGAVRSFGIHWATFQLGDEEPMQPAKDLAAVLAERGVDGFGLLPVGGWFDVEAVAAPALASR
jgi:L-ascorbate metabolism protein UlaG (beta-lactamase superfamily)